MPRPRRPDFDSGAKPQENLMAELYADYAEFRYVENERRWEPTEQMVESPMAAARRRVATVEPGTVPKERTSYHKL